MTGAAVWVYGFDVLPEPFCLLLAEAATLADSLTVALVMDAKEALDGRIFLTQRRTVADLARRLNERGVPHEIRYLPLIDDGRAPALRHLERYLFTRGTRPLTATHPAWRSMPPPPPTRRPPGPRQSCAAGMTRGFPGGAWRSPWRARAGWTVCWT